MCIQVKDVAAEDARRHPMVQPRRKFLYEQLSPIPVLEYNNYY